MLPKSLSRIDGRSNVRTSVRLYPVDVELFLRHIENAEVPPPGEFALPNLMTTKSKSKDVGESGATE